MKSIFFAWIILFHGLSSHAFDFARVDRIECTRQDNPQFKHTITPNVFHHGPKHFVALTGSKIQRFWTESGPVDREVPLEVVFYELKSAGTEGTMILENLERVQWEQRLILKVVDSNTGLLEKGWFRPGLPGYNPPFPGQGGTFLYDCVFVSK